MYIPVPAIIHAMIAPKGPVADPKRAGRLKIPAPTIEPTTIAVSAGSDILRADGVDCAFALVVSVMVCFLVFPKRRSLAARVSQKI
ncbi:hypothetical protein [Roseobacter denitrificans]|uniref:hypothetical protein n=1 Tax=Roseobacter denitrificans TaxID=2434 RepID=UPI001C0CBCCC|nr:hypothetical protein [Roseobacter denitrificans]